jgi:CBS domain-containing protein
MSTNGVVPSPKKQVNSPPAVVHNRVPPGSGDWVPQDGGPPGGNFPLGDVAWVSNQFENGRVGNPVLDPKAVGAITNDPGDRGGLSVGIPQFSAVTGDLQQYLTWLGKSHPDLRRALGGPPFNKQFQDNWRQLARARTQDFGNAQLEFFKGKVYDPVVKLCLQRTGIDMSKAPLPLQQAFWSSVIQHGTKAVTAVQAGLDAQTPGKNFHADYKVNGKPIDLGRVLYGLYSWRGMTNAQGRESNFLRSSPGIQRGVAHRFGQERLAILKEYLGGSLDKGKVSDLMTSKVITAGSGQTVADFLKTSGRNPAQMHNGYPVVDSKGRCIGLVTRRRLLAANPSTTVDRILPTKKVVTISSEMSARDAFNLMTSKGVSQVVVTDPKTGKVKGMMSTIDLLGTRNLAPTTAQKAAQHQPGDRWVENGVQVARALPVDPRLGGG